MVCTSERPSTEALDSGILAMMAVVQTLRKCALIVSLDIHAMSASIAGS